MNNVLAVCEVWDKEYEPGWGVRHEPVGLIISTSSEGIETLKKEMAKRDTAHFSYDYGKIEVFRTDNQDITREVNESGTLRVCNLDRIKWIKSELKPF